MKQWDYPGICFQGQGLLVLGAAQEPFAPSGKGGYAAAKKEEIAAVKMVTGCSKSSTARTVVESWMFIPLFAV
jgi:hypothetical protein